MGTGDVDCAIRAGCLDARERKAWQVCCTAAETTWTLSRAWIQWDLSGGQRPQASREQEKRRKEAAKIEKTRGGARATARESGGRVRSGYVMHKMRTGRLDHWITIG